MNQHLFKVTSKSCSKWLYYMWVSHHLETFREIAADKATTMGHIQRRHLNEALTIIPDAAMLTMMSHHMQPLFDRCLSLRLTSRALAAQRDVLLPRLVSGDMRMGRATQWT